MSGRPSYGNSSGVIRQPSMPGGMGGAGGGYPAPPGGGANNTFISNPWSPPGSAPVGGGATTFGGTMMTDLSAPYSASRNPGGIANTPPGVQASTPDPSMRTRIFGDPNSMMGQPRMNGPFGPGVPSQPLNIIATGPLASNGQHTVTFDDVDRYRRGLLGV